MSLSAGKFGDKRVLVGCNAVPVENCTFNHCLKAVWCISDCPGHGLKNEKIPGGTFSSPVPEQPHALAKNAFTGLFRFLKIFIPSLWVFLLLLVHSYLYLAIIRNYHMVKTKRRPDTIVKQPLSLKPTPDSIRKSSNGTRNKQNVWNLKTKHPLKYIYHYSFKFWIYLNRWVFFMST